MSLLINKILTIKIPNPLNCVDTMLPVLHHQPCMYMTFIQHVKLVDITLTYANKFQACFPSGKRGTVYQHQHHFVLYELVFPDGLQNSVLYIFYLQPFTLFIAVPHHELLPWSSPDRSRLHYKCSYSVSGC